MADENLSLHPTDIIGIIQRGLRELAVYCERPAESVDPTVIVGYMGRLAEFAQRLPMPQPPPQQAGDASGARAN